MTDGHSLKIADAGERAGALRKARRNSVFVRAMRLALPVAAIMLLSSYAIFMQRTIKVDQDGHSGRLSTGTVSATLDNLAMTDPSYEGYSKKDGSRFKVSAKKAITDLSRDKPIKLLGIDGAFEQANGLRTEIKAINGVFDQKAGTLRLDGGINVNAPNSISVALNSAIVDTRTSQISSDEPVLVKLPSGQVRGNAMRLDQKARAIVFRNGVAAQLRPTPKQKSLGSQPQTAQANDVLGFGGASSAPVDITSATLAIAEKERTAQFTGDVRAEQGGRILMAPTLRISFAGGASMADLAKSGGDAKLSKSGGRLRKIEASGGVRLTQDGNQIRARTASFNVEQNTAELTGGVRISGPARRTLDADIATIDTASNTVVFTGNVVARQDSNVLRGSRMVYEPRSGRMQLASPAIAGAPAGNVFVRFQRPATPKAKKNKQRRLPISGGVAFSTNPDAPIEITTRKLDLLDGSSTARFEGGVRARQGDFLLTTPVMTAHYDGKIGLLGSVGHASSGGKDAFALRFIRASNPVTVSSGPDMNASGEQAEFDLRANKVVIHGNVVLKNGRQIVRGERLTIDLKTGFSRMENAAGERNTSKRLTHGAAPRITSNPRQRDCGGQMCAVFFPGDLQRKKERRKSRPRGTNDSEGRRPSVGSGWSASTRTN